MNEYAWGLNAVFCNAFLWLVMMAVQNLQAAFGIIPKRTKDFIYMQDFWTNGWRGDLLGLSCIDFAVGIIAFHHQGDSGVLLLIPILLGIVAVRVFYLDATKPARKKSDWGFLKDSKNPRGWRVTLGRKIHLVYLFLQVSVGVLGVELLVVDRGVIHAPAISVLLGLLGAVIYGYATYRDSQGAFKFLTQ